MQDLTAHSGVRRRMEKAASAAVALVTSTRLPATSGTPADEGMGELSDLSTWSLTTKQTCELSIILSALGPRPTCQNLCTLDDTLHVGDGRTRSPGVDKGSDRLEARERSRTDRLLLLIGSFRCVDSSQLQTLSSD